MRTVRIQTRGRALTLGLALLTALALALHSSADDFDDEDELEFDQFEDYFDDEFEFDDEHAPYPWREHAAPFDFTFGTMIDSHQQSSILPTGELRGFLYVHETGEITDDGFPVAERVNCHGESGTVGWILKGIPVWATLVHKGPRVWLVNEADLPPEQGYRHFQWVGEPHSPHGLVVGETYPGYLMKRIAPEPFFWLGNTEKGRHGGRLVPEGVDPHTNSQTWWNGDVGRGCTGHDDGTCSHDDGAGGHDDDGGGCTGHDGGCTHDDSDDGGCAGGGGGGGGGGDDGGCSHDDDGGGCTGHDGGCSHDETGGEGG